MAPLILGEECMMCHGEEGRKVGDSYGGISVSVPASSIKGFIDERTNRQIESHLFLAFAGMIALVIGYWLQSKLNRRLNRAKNNLQLAYLDALTLLPNRRYYDAFLRREWKRASRHNYPLSMIMIDIDYFKLYNDSLGHMEGDQCLKHVARTLRRYFRRSGDLIARYGGEEFCVVAACDSDQIMDLAKMLRMAVEMMQLPHPNSPISSYVTISLGVATLLPTERTECSLLLHQADQALYSAKQAGRNRAMRYQG
ncbi:MAG: diguanylate cyclase domain-containing protein [Gammaproteobacteria bacterium]